MNDYNFFEENPQQTLNLRFKKLYGIVIALVLICIFGGITVFNIIKINTLNKEIASMEEILNSQENIKKLEEVNKLSKKLDILNKYYDAVSSADKTINDGDNIKSSLINEISSTVPEDVYFGSININSSNINIQASGKSRRSIAEFEYNLKNLNIFESVYIDSISESQNNKYVFNVKCILKDVDENEGN